MNRRSFIKSAVYQDEYVFERDEFSIDADGNLRVRGLIFLLDKFESQEELLGALLASGIPCWIRRPPQ